MRVDLSESEDWVQTISDGFCEKYVGGAGFGAKIIWDETDSDTDPLGPENRIIFGVGPFQGTRIPGSAKFSVVGKSPLTKTYGEAAGSADWGPTFRRCSFDSLVIQGRAEHPVFLWITDENVEIRDASPFWGMDAIEVVDALRRDVGDDKASVATIGQAGERLVRIACVCLDAHSYAGRAGLGAVMGSKNLKAVVVSGRQTPPPYQADSLSALAKALFRKIYDETGGNGFRLHGTAGIVTDVESYGDMPIKYWRGDVWPEGAASIGCPRYTEVMEIEPWGCMYCPIQCHRRVGVSDPSGKPFTGPGPQYETLGMFGANCMVDDVFAIARANVLANRFGIDTISAGAMVGFAMECQERGWLSPSDTGGIDFRWGNGEALIEMVRQVGLREGFGAEFADGTVAAAEMIGSRAADIVVHVRGLDLPAHDPRACFSLAPNYATSTRGACHVRGFPEDAEMGAFVCPECAATLAAAIRLFKQGRIGPDEKVLLLNTGTGLKYLETVNVKALILEPDDDLLE